MDSFRLNKNKFFCKNKSGKLYCYKQNKKETIKISYDDYVVARKKSIKNYSSLCKILGGDYSDNKKIFTLSFKLKTKNVLFLELYALFLSKIMEKYPNEYKAIIAKNNRIFKDVLLKKLNNIESVIFKIVKNDKIIKILNKTFVKFYIQYGGDGDDDHTLYKNIIEKLKDNKINGNIRNFVIITDIGRDIDDTLALYVLLGLYKMELINIHSIIVSGLNLINRAKLVKYYLIKSNIRKNIPIYITNNHSLYTEDKEGGDYTCIKPLDFNNIITTNFNFDPIVDYKNNNSYINNIVLNTYIKPYDWLILSSPLPLKHILKHNNNIINNIYAQGSIKENFNNIIIPELEAYNFGGLHKLNPTEKPNLLDDEYIDFKENNDKNSMVFILKNIKDDVSVNCLGKETAYLFKLKKENIKDNNLITQAKNGLLKFFFLNHTVFLKVFPAFDYNNPINRNKDPTITIEEEDLNTLKYIYNNKTLADSKDEDTVFNILNKDKVSNGYDLIATILAIFPEFFNNEYENVQIKNHFNYNVKDKNIINEKFQSTFIANVDYLLEKSIENCNNTHTKFINDMNKEIRHVRNKQTEHESNLPFANVVKFEKTL
jgi:hypothetical protein